MSSIPETDTNPVGAVPVQVVTTPGCHLCIDGVAVVERVAEEVGVAWQELSLSQVPAGPERDRWSVEVPVLLIDGVQRDFWQIDPGRMRRLLHQRGTR